MMRRPLLAAALLACSPAFAQAPDGPEFRVNTFTPDAQFKPAIGTSHGGEFVIVYTQAGPSGAVIKGQRFAANGSPFFSEITISTGAPGIGEPRDPAAAWDRWGGFLAVWDAPTSTAAAVFGQKIDRFGQRVGAELRYTPPTAENQFWPQLAPMRDGGFFMVWTCSENQNRDICGRRLAPSGEVAGPTFIVNSTTTDFQDTAAVARESDGGFVVTWVSGASGDIRARRFDPALGSRGPEFAVNSNTAGSRGGPIVAADGRGGFIVVWHADVGNGDGWEVAARRFLAGAPVGAEFIVNAYTTNVQGNPSVATDEAGNFVVTWTDWTLASSSYDIHGRRFFASGAPRGAQFVAETDLASRQGRPVAFSDRVGNFVLAWESRTLPAPSDVYARSFGGLRPFQHEISGGPNPGLVEVPSSFLARTKWRNDSSASQAFQGRVVASAPAGMTVTIDPDTDYPTLPPGTADYCTAPCYAGSVAGQRPTGHVDLNLDETLLPDAQGQTRRWLVHVGSSFADVPASNPFYRWVETILHRGVTGGCTPTTYCPSAPVMRDQMAVFILVANDGAGYVPSPCGATPLFADVPASNPFCPWVEELARRGVAGGCGGGNYCPAAAVSREQMAVFVQRIVDPVNIPPACTTPTVFADVPATSPYCRWIEALYHRSVVTGCGGANYCPTAPTTREQMSAFLTVGFALWLP